MADAPHPVKNYYIIYVLGTQDLLVAYRLWMFLRAGSTVLVYLPLSFQDHDLIVRSGGPHCRSWHPTYATLVRGFDTHTEAYSYLNNYKKLKSRHAAAEKSRKITAVEQNAVMDGNKNGEITLLEILLRSPGTLENLLRHPQPIVIPSVPTTLPNTNTVLHANPNAEKSSKSVPFEGRRSQNSQNPESNKGAFKKRFETQNGNPYPNFFTMGLVIDSTVRASLDPQEVARRTVFDPPVQGCFKHLQKQKEIETTVPTTSINQQAFIERAQFSLDEKTKESVPEHTRMCLQNPSKSTNIVNPGNPPQIARVAPLKTPSVIVFNKYSKANLTSDCEAKSSVPKPIDTDTLTTKDQGDVIEILSDSDISTDAIEVQDSFTSEQSSIQNEEGTRDIRAPLDFSRNSEIVQTYASQSESIGVKICSCLETSVKLTQELTDPLTANLLNESVTVTTTESVNEDNILENTTGSPQNQQSCDSENGNTHISDNVNTSSMETRAESLNSTYSEQGDQNFLEVFKVLFTSLNEKLEICHAFIKNLHSMSEAISKNVGDIMIAEGTNSATTEEQNNKCDLNQCQELAKQSNESTNGSQDSRTGTTSDTKIRRSSRLSEKLGRRSNVCDDDTLKHQTQDPETDFSTLTELLPDSNIYVSERGLEYSKAFAEDTSDFTRLLLREVFNETALKECTITGVTRKRKYSKIATRELDRHAVTILCEYVAQFSATMSTEGWHHLDAEAVRRIIANRLTCSKVGVNIADAKVSTDISPL